jgi:hypothetical protein
MREYRNRDEEEFASYAKPPVSAWVAGLAVAFAFFVMGGFIKTYLQLEALREESRHEIRELKAAIETIRSAPNAPSSRQPQKRIALLPQASRTRAIDAPLASSPSAPGRPLLADIEDERTRPNGVTYSIGRSTRRAGDGYGAVVGEREKPVCQVVAVNSAQKLIMVEGGLDQGLSSGARLELSRAGRWIGDLRVVDVFETMSSCEVLLSTIMPEPGDVVRTP